MSAQRSTSPHVFRAINRITAAFAKAGIAKTHMNLQDQYQYRSIDDLLGRLSPLLAKHGLCVLPRVLAREAEDRCGEGDSVLVSVRLLVAFDLVSCRDGSSHSVQAWGEALDGSDKGTAKAMSAAYKSAMLQTFCVPVSREDADAGTHRLKRKSHQTEPVEGWGVWSEGIIDIIAVCESNDALDCIRSRQSALLAAIRSERPELYASIGQAFAARSRKLTEPGSQSRRPGLRTASTISPESQQEPALESADA